MKTIEGVINDVLTGHAKENALSLIAHLRASGEPGKFTFSLHDENDDSGWVISNVGFMFIDGSEGFPGPWTLWMGEVTSTGEDSDISADAHIKEIAWSHIAPCNSCGGDCAPGVNAEIFGKSFENTCQAQLMFNDPDADTVDCMKKIIDICNGIRGI
jgi:hypothetical protein